MPLEEAVHAVHRASDARSAIYYSSAFPRKIKSSERTIVSNTKSSRFFTAGTLSRAGNWSRRVLHFNFGLTDYCDAACQLPTRSCSFATWVRSRVFQSLNEQQALNAASSPNDGMLCPSVGYKFEG